MRKLLLAARYFVRLVRELLLRRQGCHCPGDMAVGAGRYITLLFAGECKECQVPGPRSTPHAVWRPPLSQLVSFASVSIATVQAPIPQSGPCHSTGSPASAPPSFVAQRLARGSAGQWLRRLWRRDRRLKIMFLSKKNNFGR